MPNSQIPLSKRFLRALARNALYAVRWIIQRLPLAWFKVLTPFFMTIGAPLLIGKKRIVMENLHNVFKGEKSAKEIKQIANKYFYNMAHEMIELTYLIDRIPKILEKVSIEGKEHLDEALKGGKGVILLSAHFGNFILMYIRMALAGYKINCIMRRMKDEQFEAYISDFREKNGIQTIYSLPHRQCVGGALKCLRNNEVLFILLDQNYGEEGAVYVDFLGKSAATATGPIVFSQRSGAPILPAFIVGEEDHYKIIIDPPVVLEDVPAGESEMAFHISKLTKVIESYIRRYPHEWGGWTHRRWKTQPMNRQSSP